MMAFKGALVIDTEKCKGCAVCITGCPNQCIALSKHVNAKGYNYLEMV
ncbi:MAG: 4Fe-4S binding protein, partial [Bacteroidales bacterium]|nr:4Fe-4S binding protein [Bacteroidales bacterium]